jgi:hypothetical protein
MYRFLTFDSQLYSDLHGAAAVTKKGNAVLFGDGINCIGKTTASLTVASSSGKYLVDECTLFNQATGNVYGNKEMPIHVRPCYAEHFEKRFKVKLNLEKGYGAFVKPEDLGLEVLEKAPLKAVVCPRPNDHRVELVEEKNPFIKARKMAIVANAHHLKFMDESLDRANGKTDNANKEIELSDLTSGYFVPKALLELPYYDAYIIEPDDMLKLIEGANL